MADRTNGKSELAKVEAAVHRFRAAVAQWIRHEYVLTCEETRFAIEVSIDRVRAKPELICDAQSRSTALLIVGEEVVWGMMLKKGDPQILSILDSKRRDAISQHVDEWLALNFSPIEQDSRVALVHSSVTEALDALWGNREFFRPRRQYIAQLWAAYAKNAAIISLSVDDTELVCQYLDKALHAYLHAILGTKGMQEIHDIAQEAWLRFFSSSAQTRLRIAGSASAYLKQIARNCLIDQSRRPSIVREGVDLDTLSDPEAETSYARETSSRGGNGAVNGTTRLIQDLPPKHRRLLELHALYKGNGYARHAVEEQLYATEEVARNTFRRLKQKLKSRI